LETKPITRGTKESLGLFQTYSSGSLTKESNLMIEIVDYKKSWPKEFVRIGAVIRNALNERAVRIDHIGSTSVPGLESKDVIDIQ